MKICLASASIMIAGGVLADVPDYSIHWDFLEIHEPDGATEVLDCFMYDGGGGFAVAYLSRLEDRLEVWVLDQSGEGAPLNRRRVPFDIDPQRGWAVSRFADDSTLVLVRGSHDDAFPVIRFEDLNRTEGSAEKSLAGLCPGAGNLTVGDMAVTGGGEILLTGSGETSGEGFRLFACALDMEGEPLWRTTLVEGADGGMERAVIAALEDGGCVLSFEPDHSSPGIPVFRLDPEGGVAWEILIRFDTGFGEGINSMLELEDGSIVCAGSFRHSFEMAERGFMVCLDPSGNELWRRVDWYLDHTSLTAVQEVGPASLLLSGWTGFAGECPSDAGETDVLLAQLDTGRDRLTGCLVSGEGSQRPHSVFSTGDGGFTVIGEHAGEDGEGSDIFIGRAVIPDDPD